MSGLTDLSKASDEVLTCREIGHSWAKSGVQEIVRNVHGDIIEATLTNECPRCEARRARRVGLPDFTILRSTMAYPHGYLAARGYRFSRAEARRVAFGRALGRFA